MENMELGEWTMLWVPDEMFKPYSGWQLKWVLKRNTTHKPHNKKYMNKYIQIHTYLLIRNTYNLQQYEM